MKINLFKKEKNRISNNYLINFLKKNLFFILFAFFSCLAPIVLCLISSLIKPSGSQAVMATGYLSPFFLSFIQISLSLSLFIFFKLKTKISTNGKNYNKCDFLYSNLIWISIYIGIIMIALYILSSYLYIFFSSNRPNTYLTLKYGYDFIWTSCISVFLTTIYTSLLFLIFINNNRIAILFEIFNFFLIFIFPLIFTLWTNLEVIGIGIGILLALIINIVVNWCYLRIKYAYNLYSPKEMFIYTKQIFIFSSKEALTFISLSLIKGVAILCISFAIPFQITDFIPLSYQMSRVLWFNMMYFIPFLGIGIGEGIKVNYLSQDKIIINYMDHSRKKDAYITLFTIIITIFFCVGGIYMIKPLTNVYITHDYNPFLNNQMPELNGWGTPSALPENIKIQWEGFNKKLEELSGLDFNNNNDKIKALLIIKSSINIFKSENPILTEWLSQEINNVSLFNYLINNLPNALKYFIYLRLYSSIDVEIVNSFLNLREIFPINTNSVSMPIYLFLTYIQTYNANSMIYICLFALLNSIWSIWIQTSSRNSGKYLPSLLLLTVYIFSIGGLVSFGVIFGVIYNNYDWNPFRYLDAWTFPLVIISSLVIIVIWTKNHFSYKKLKNTNTQISDTKCNKKIFNNASE